MPDGSDSGKHFIIRQQSRGTYESVGNAASYLLDEIYQPVSQELFSHGLNTQQNIVCPTILIQRATSVIMDMSTGCMRNSKSK
jgi:hypothetical protein